MAIEFSFSRIKPINILQILEAKQKFAYFLFFFYIFLLYKSMITIFNASFTIFNAYAILKKLALKQNVFLPVFFFC